MSLIRSRGACSVFGYPIIWALVLWAQVARIHRRRPRCASRDMYRLDRADLEWILDADDSSESFPTLKNNELKEFGEYRTQCYALDAYDRIARGEPPDIPDSE